MAIFRFGFDAYFTVVGCFVIYVLSVALSLLNALRFEFWIYKKRHEENKLNALQWIKTFAIVYVSICVSIYVCVSVLFITLNCNVAHLPLFVTFSIILWLDTYWYIDVCVCAFDYACIWFCERMFVCLCMFLYVCVHNCTNDSCRQLRAEKSSQHRFNVLAL